jgi:hypothetical protein
MWFVVPDETYKLLVDSEFVPLLAKSIAIQQFDIDQCHRSVPAVI